VTDRDQRAPDAANPAVPDEKWRIYTLYESGKGRRYGLLFTVNGGAYALVGFLVGGSPTFELSLLTVWAFVLIPAALALFTLQMQKDIQAFGEYMRDLAAPHGLTLFGQVGQDVLKNICRLIVAAWCAAILAFLISIAW
jgi:hypothetical protein